MYKLNILSTALVSPNVLGFTKTCLLLYNAYKNPALTLPSEPLILLVKFLDITLPSLSTSGVSITYLRLIGFLEKASFTSTSASFAIGAFAPADTASILRYFISSELSLSFLKALKSSKALSNCSCTF